MRSLDNRHVSGQDDHWIPLSDLMTGLMMMFLLIAIVYMIKVEADTKLIKETSARTQEIARLYQQTKSELYDDLRKEFEKDLPRWDAELLSDATLRFKAPEVMFDSGRADLKPRFKEILADFFPRYVAILTSDRFRSTIQEIRIEGHTSSFWQGAPTEEDAYFQNMRLSQDRTRSALEYVMKLTSISKNISWLRTHVTANGLSYSKIILNAKGAEDFVHSQRVEFRVRTDAESRIEKIIEATQ
jgi:outer membrane protein OmpA-like peptidoglycan-associated protein